MTRYLHGGGVPLVCDLTVADIAREDLQVLPFSGRFSEPMGDGLREVTLKAEVLRTETQESGGRPQYVARFADDETRHVLRREAAAPQHAVRTGPEAPAEVKFYFRIVDTKCGGASTVPTETLRALAAAMKADRRPQTPSAIPAAYTYLGQFIAHDMTWMDTRADCRDAINLRSHALDLDSLFGAIPPEGRITEAVKCADGLCIGQTSAGRYEDLPRTATGFPCIPDPRNDNNLAVAQLTVAMMKFHRRVCELTKGCSSEEQRRITRRHVQSVVLHDYLPRIIDPDVYCDVMHRGGRKVIFPSNAFGSSLPKLFQVPMEFAAACFRFGHSMVRETYAWNTAHPAQNFFTEIRIRSHLGNITESNNCLADDWVVDWDRLIRHSDAADLAQNASCIGGKLSQDLFSLGVNWLEDSAELKLSGGFPNLAEATLLRGQQLGLVNGQTLQQLVSEKTKCKNLDPDKIHSELNRLADFIGPRACKEISLDTPLWLFVLCEAQAHGCKGQHLGPIGSRIVMETLHASIEAASGGILSGDSFATLKKLGALDYGKYKLDELIRASSSSELETWNSTNIGERSYGCNNGLQN